MAKKYLYKFLRTGLRSDYDGSVWEIGKWREVPASKGKCVGLNASEYVQDAMYYVKGDVLAKVECAGKIIKDDTKCTCQKVRVVAVADWTRWESVALAVYAARLVLPVWEKEHPQDDRPRKAIEAAEAVLARPCEKTRDAALNAWGTVWVVTWPSMDAAGAAARAAGAAAWAASRSLGVESAASAASDAAIDAAWAASRTAGAAKGKAKASVRRRIHLYALSLVRWRKA